jgi:hypothetical protein
VYFTQCLFRSDFTTYVFISVPCFKLALLYSDTFSKADFLFNYWNRVLLSFVPVHECVPAPVFLVVNGPNVIIAE